MKTFKEANAQLTELKNKELELQLKNYNINNKSNDILKVENNKINVLQKKITDLELKLKLSEQKYFTILAEGKNPSIEIYSNKNKINIVNESSNRSHIHELYEMKNKNNKLEENIKKLRDDYAKSEREKLDLITKVNQFNNDKKLLISLLDKKEEDINNRKNIQLLLNDDINKQLNENSIIKNNLNIMQNKCKVLLKSKSLLEDTVIKKESKVNELDKSMNEIMKIMNKKEVEINNDKVYINSLKDIIKELQQKYNTNKNNKKKILNSKMNFSYLKKENEKINIINRNDTNSKKYLKKNNYIYNLYRNNSNKKDNRYNENIKMNQRYYNLRHNKSTFEENNSINTLFSNSNNLQAIIRKNKNQNSNNKRNKMYNRENNNSLPDLNELKIKINIRNKIISDGVGKNEKSQLIKNNSIMAFNIPKFENKLLNNSPIHKIYEKHYNNCKKEEFEKQKIEEVKELFDKIVSDFQT